MRDEVYAFLEPLVPAQSDDLEPSQPKDAGHCRIKLGRSLTSLARKAVSQHLEGTIERSKRVQTWIPTFDADQRQTAVSRAALDVFLKKAGAQLWIQHDFNANAKLKKAPNYYE